MIALRHYWAQRTPRERVLIQIMIILGIGLGVWLGIVRPVNRALAIAQQDVAIAARHYQAIQYRVAVIKRRPRGASERLNVGIDTFIAESATDRGLTAVPDVPSNDGGALWRIDQASPRAVFGWLEMLEQRGVVVKTLAVEPVDGELVSAAIAFRPAVN
jgi:general secretion pathway protein M